MVFLNMVMNEFRTFIAELERHCVNRRACRQSLKRNDDMQTLAPAPESHAGFAAYQPRERTFAHRISAPPFRDRAAVGGVVEQRRSDLLQPGIVGDREKDVVGRQQRELIQQHSGEPPHRAVLRIVGREPGQ